MKQHLRSELAVLLAASLIAGTCLALPPQPVSAHGNVSNAVYVVGWGDTLESTASTFGMSATDLAENNGLPPKPILGVGQRLMVPGSYAAPVLEHWQRYEVKAGDTITTIAVKHNTPVAHILVANRLRPTSALAIGQALIIPKAPYRQTLAVQPAPPCRESLRYAANAQLLGRAHPAILQGILGMGFGWLRQEVHWQAIEPEPGKYEWDELDRLVADASAAGLRVLLQVGGFPASEAPISRDSLHLTNDEMRRYAELLLHMAARYRGQVQAYEIWNAPNTSLAWGVASMMPAEEYVALLKLAYSAVKASDPDAIVVTAALMPTESHNPRESLAHDDYLDLMYKSGAKDYFDAVGAQSWGYNNPPNDGPTRSTVDTTSFKGSWPLYFRSFELLYDVMKRHGDSAKQIWLVKFGWPASTTPIPGHEYAADNSEQEQASYLAGAYILGCGHPYLGFMGFWNFNYAPQVVASDIRGAYSIMNQHKTPRLAMEVLALTIRSIPKTDPQ